MKDEKTIAILKAMDIIDIVYYKLVGKGDVVALYETEKSDEVFEKVVAKLAEKVCVFKDRNIVDVISTLQSDFTIEECENDCEGETRIPSYWDFAFGEYTTVYKIIEILMKIKTSYNYGHDFLTAFCMTYDILPELCPELPPFEEAMARARNY